MNKYLNIFAQSARSVIIFLFYLICIVYYTEQKYSIDCVYHYAVENGVIFDWIYEFNEHGQCRRSETYEEVEKLHLTDEVK